jgi:hypothetical protein
MLFEYYFDYLIIRMLFYSKWMHKFNYLKVIFIVFNQLKVLHHLLMNPVRVFIDIEGS